MFINAVDDNCYTCRLLLIITTLIGKAVLWKVMAPVKLCKRENRITHVEIMLSKKVNCFNFLYFYYSHTKYILRHTVILTFPFNHDQKK